MEAVEFNPQLKEVKLVKKEIPDVANDNEVLVKVAYAGICGTDLHIIDGEFPCKTNGSITLGHEFCGVVAKIGKNIKHVKIGDKVVIDPNKGCMLCDKCRNGNIHFCRTGGLNSTIGIYRNGGWEQYCSVPDIQIHKLPETITLEQAVLCEPMSCISHAWDKIQPLTIGKKILIIGAGIIGNLFASLLHLHGHKKVTLSEPNLDRLKLTEKLDTGFNLITPDTLKDYQKEVPNCMLFDVIIDCSGNTCAIEHAFDLLDFGGKLCIFGVANPSKTISVPPFALFQKELTIFGVVINPFCFVKSINLIETMSDRYINFDKLGVKTFALSEYQAAINSLRKGSIAKAVFKM